MFLNKRLVISVHPLGLFQKRSIVLLLPLFTGLVGSKSVVELWARLAVLTSEGTALCLLPPCQRHRHRAFLELAQVEPQ